MKKLGAASYLNVVAAVLGVVGLVATVVCSSISVDNALVSLGACVAAAVVGVVLCAVAVFGSVKLNNDYVRSVSVLVTIALYMYVVCNLIVERVMLVAGLFSYASGNEVGWQVFSATIVAAAALLVGCVVLIVSSFLKSTKE